MRNFDIRFAHLTSAIAIAAALATPAMAQSSSPAPKVGDPPEARDMRLVGMNDLQARSAYQPTIHKQGDRYIAYVGHHGGTPEVPKPLNPLTGQAEFNGTSIIDVTDPSKPKYLFHIPGQEGNFEAGGAQMTRVCDGSALPKGDRNAVYLLRSFGGAGHEIWNVADPAKPVLVSKPSWNLKDTHKSFWECDTGIAYLVSGVDGWRSRRMTEVFDLSDPSKPVKIRDFGLVGQEPGTSGTVPTDLHGMISTGPQGNRIYFGYGTNKGGVVQIIDREKLLNGPKEPTPENLRSPIVRQIDLLPISGAHTTVPLLGVPVAEFAKDKDGKVRDFIMIVNEQILNECLEPRQMVYFMDITVEIAADGGVELQRARGERKLLRPRRPVRLAFRERKHGAGVPQEGGVLHLVQRRGARGRHPRSVSAEGDRLFHPVDHGSHRKALHQGGRQGPLQDRDPEQQSRDRRPGLRVRR